MKPHIRDAGPGDETTVVELVRELARNEGETSAVTGSWWRGTWPSPPAAP
ncbi:MAG TPA: hypothetical protein VJ787_05415 [Thermoleophilia bacterium]|nr:hypothetical protein [Thermoleophilia bacterium]